MIYAWLSRFIKESLLIQIKNIPRMLFAIFFADLSFALMLPYVTKRFIAVALHETMIHPVTFHMLLLSSQITHNKDTWKDMQATNNRVLKQERLVIYLSNYLNIHNLF
jgi:hypothetical protein